MDKPLQLGIAGLGTVGSSVVRIINQQKEQLSRYCFRPLKITGVSARQRELDRGINLENIKWFDNPVDMAASNDIDILVEAIGGDSEPAFDVVKTAIKNGIHVVTANKALLAYKGNDLAEMAEKFGVSLNYEAAVGGGIPIIKTMREAIVGNEISRVYGILNGTCNYILTRMERENISYFDCLAEAQNLGYAEADPTFDVGGYDSAHKLAILTSLAFGTRIDISEIFIEGISNITIADIQAARRLGYRIKLLGVASKTDTGIEQRVHPTLVPLHSDIAGIHDVTNAIVINGNRFNQVMLSGPGAGGDATASAIIADINDIARNIKIPAMGLPVKKLLPYSRARMRAHEGGYYIRLQVYDKAGVFADIANRIGQENISLRSIVQNRTEDNYESISNVPNEQQIIILTYKTTELSIRSAIEKIRTDGHLSQNPQMIRIEQ